MNFNVWWDLIWCFVIEESLSSSNENMIFFELLKILHFRLRKESNIVNDKSRNNICE